MTAPCAYYRTAEDDEDELDSRRARTYVRSAAYEQSMGAGGVADFEVPAPADEEALECPDRGTKAEWDALWPFEEHIRRSGFGDAEAMDVAPEKLRWLKPEREGGASAEEYDAALREHPPAVAAEDPVRLADLDPTQLAFAQ